MAVKHIFLIMTDSCNFTCSYCYKREVTAEATGDHMTRKTAAAILDWAIDNGVWDPNNIKSVINLWGGEPFVNYELIEMFLTEYPQMHFRMNTNGSLVTRARAEFIIKHRYHLTLAVSLGSAHETYGGMDKALQKLSPIIEMIASTKGGWGANFTVSRADKLYEDYKMIRDAGISSILIDIPKFTEITDAYKDAFIENYLKIVKEYKIRDKRGTEKGINYCGSGIDRIAINPKGDVYPCDGMYGQKLNRLGNIFDNFDMKAFDFFEKTKKEASKFYDYCKDCKVQCSFERCMAVNISKNKDMFVPDPNWCKIREIFKELREKEGDYVKGPEDRSKDYGC